ATCLLFFFQAEDGIRDDLVTGVQTCALPIWIRTSALGCSSGKQSKSARAASRDPFQAARTRRPSGAMLPSVGTTSTGRPVPSTKIGRASCRERVQRLAREAAAKQADRSARFI